MAAEIVDYFLIFWVVLAATVFAIGNLYDKQQREKRRKIQQQEAKRARLQSQDPWASRAPSAYNEGDERQFGNSAAYHQSAASAAANYSSPAHQYQPSPGYAAGGGQFSADGPSNWLPAASRQQQVSSSSASGYYDQQRSVLLDEADEAELRRQRTRRSTDFAGIAGDAATEPATIPTASGFNSDCVEWVNAILYLFYANSDKYGPIICENVYRSLNEKLSSLISASSEHSHLLVEFEGVNANSSSRPELTNVRTESESDKSVSATCKIYNRRISLNLSIKRLVGRGSAYDAAMDGGEQATRYELVLENVEGKLKSMAMLSEKLIVVQFIEKPDTKILLRPLTIIRLGRAPPAEPLISEDALVQLILQTLTQVVVDLYFGNDLDFPQYRHRSASSTYANYKNKLNNIIKGSASELKRQIKQDFFGALASDQKERKVFVKIIKAKNINYNQNVTCLLELDAPRQQAVSSTKQGSEPVWDEHFLFNVTDKSGALTLELWDSISAAALAAAAGALSAGSTAPDTPTSSLKRAANKNANRWHRADLTAGAKFLGLARVPIEELRRNPIQKVSLTLQPMVANDDPNHSVGGELQLELLFMEHSADQGAAGPQTTSTSSSSGPGGRAPSPLLKSNSMSSLARYQQGDIVSIDRKLTPSGFVITTTTITKAPKEARQQQQQQQQLRHQQVRNHDLLLSARNQSPAGSSSVNTEPSFDDGGNFDLVLGGPPGGGSSPAGDSTASRRGQPDGRSETGAESNAPGRTSRSRSRSRSFIRAIRKRLSFSRTRSRSVGESGAESPRAPSAGLDAPDYESRSRASSEVSAGTPSGVRAKSMPASREPSEVPTIVINKGGRLSDLGAASAFTFAHPKSQLVIEVVEPGLREEGAETARDHVRHYAVPDDPASQRKWRKRGTKLHVFNEHQFVACHLAGSSTCHLCGRVFSRRPGKQGYKCRNCHLLSHKECHVKVDHICPYAQRDGLRLEYIDADPPASLVDEMMHGGGSGGLGQLTDNDVGAPDQQVQDFQYQQPRPARRLRPSRPGLKSTAKSISMEMDDR